MYYYEILILLFWNFSKELLLQSRLQPFYEKLGLAKSRPHKLWRKITDIRINKMYETYLINCTTYISFFGNWLEMTTEFDTWYLLRCEKF